MDGSLSLFPFSLRDSSDDPKRKSKEVEIKLSRRDAENRGKARGYTYRQQAQILYRFIFLACFVRSIVSIFFLVIRLRAINAIRIPHIYVEFLSTSTHVKRNRPRPRCFFIEIRESNLSDLRCNFSSRASWKVTVNLIYVCPVPVWYVDLSILQRERARRKYLFVFFWDSISMSVVFVPTEYPSNREKELLRDIFFANSLKKQICEKKRITGHDV